MNSRDYLAKRCSQFYSDIDTQINQLSSCSLISLHSNDIKSFKNSDKKITKTQIQNVIEAAKEFDAEVKNFVKKNATEKKPKVKSKPVCMKSTMPPIWNDKKLKTYIENVMNELEIPSEEAPTEMDTQHSYPKSILKKSIVKNEPKRNVGTNVKFLSSSLIEGNREQSKYKGTMTKPSDKHVNKEKKKTQCKKIQTIKANDSENESLTTSGTLLFASRYEQRVLNDDKNLQPKSNRPQSAPSKLVFAPITFTSTTDKGKNDDIVLSESSNLATSVIKQQLTKCVLPVLSIKRKCTIQRIYQLEILPTKDHQLNERCETKNVHFYEYQYAPAASKIIDNENSLESNVGRVVTQDIKKLNLNSTQHIQLSPTHTQHEIFPLPNIPHVPSPIERDEISATLSNLQTVLNDIKFNNGKIHVVVEKPVERKRKFLRKKIRSSLTRRSQVKTLNTRQLDITKDDSTSSMSDEKVREFLGNARKGKSSSASANPSSSPTSIPIVNDSPETSLSNYKSFYELFEKTFDKSPKRVEGCVKNNEMDIDKDVIKMKEIIMLSEDNIKKAGEILQKYQLIKSTATSKNDLKIETNEVCLQTSAIFEPESISKVEIPLKVDSCVQTICDKNMQTDGSKSRHYFKHVYDKFSNFNNINFDQPPSIPHQSTTSMMPKYLNDTVPFNTTYCDNNEVMDMANKFLRSVEKRKKKFSMSDAVGDSCSEISNLELNDRGSDMSLSFADFSSKKEENSAKKTKVGNTLTETDLRNLLSKIEHQSTSDDESSSSLSSSNLGF